MRVPRRALVLLVAAGTLAACARSPVPRKLAGLYRTRVIAGERASEMLSRMHGTDVAPADSLIVEYGRGGVVRLYLSKYSDTATAARELERMLSAMRRDVTPFTPPTEDLSTPGRWTTIGNGGHHLLWSSGKTVYWLEGPPDVVFRAADELPRPSVGRLA